MNVSDEILCKPLVWHCTLLVVFNGVSIICVLTANDTEIRWICQLTYFHCIYTFMHNSRTDHMTSVIIM